MKVITKSSVRFQAENIFGEPTQLVIRHANRGEPLRSGVEFDLDVEGRQASTTIFLEDYEARDLRNLLNRIYPPKA